MTQLFQIICVILLEKKREFNVAYDQKFNPMFVKDLKKYFSFFLKKNSKVFIMWVAMKNYQDLIV